MSATPNLGLTYLEAAQAQKHVSVNEALLRLDVLVQARVLSMALTTPPGSPADGDAYIPASGATGAWDDWDLNLAYVADGGWVKIVPKEGWLVYNLDDAGYYTFDGADWLAVPLVPQVAAEVPFTPAGGLSGDNVQTVLEELDAEKLAKAGGTMTGFITLHADPDAAMKAATKQYVDAIVAAQDAMVFKGVIDCSANPNYPAADRGWTYRVSVAGKIGGGSGTNVEAGDILICLTDGTASGNQATVGASWTISQTNLDGAVIGPSSVTDGVPVLFDGTTGKLLKATTFGSFLTALGFSAFVATLVDEANATAFLASLGIEVGTFTPSITAATVGNLSVSYVFQVGNYLKIGNWYIVVVNMRFTPTYTTASGSLRIPGLPVAVGAAHGHGFLLETGSAVDWGAGFTQLAIRLVGGNTYADILKNGDNQNGTGLPITAIPTGSSNVDLSFTGVYVA